ncbi:uncharacterized protein LOC141637304 [Silene latifolia]|uniref:uncharacterized protein LOC141637304 n=1 Tax=Silene latifolia TaxID=37657 RepID=UPI003D773D82
MDPNNPNFLQNLIEALQNLSELSPRGTPRRGEQSREEFKVSELPEFVGGTDPEDYLEWERKIERMFEFKDLDDEKCCKYAILRLSRGASLWYEGFKVKRARAGKEKISSWESLKRKLRKRYIPATYRLTTYRKIAELTQERSSVSDYINEFENLTLMGGIEESEDLKMARFLRGLNRNIANSVELQSYADFDSLCNLCLKVEAQGKAKLTPTHGEGGRSWRSEGHSRGSPSSRTVETTPKTISTPESAPKIPVPKETSLSRVWCFKCQGFGHFQNACPNKRNIALREAIAVRDELYDEEERLGGVFNFE